MLMFALVGLGLAALALIDQQQRVNQRRVQVRANRRERRDPGDRG